MLTRIHICAVWSVALLFANPDDMFSPDEAHISHKSTDYKGTYLPIENFVIRSLKRIFIIQHPKPDQSVMHILILT